jgi:hypothetical protein
VRISIRGEVFVAIPPNLSTDEVLDLSRLILNRGEFEEFRRSVEARS